MKKKAYCYKINLHFLFLASICDKFKKFLEIRGFFSIFFAGINFCDFNKIEYFVDTNFRDFGQKPRKARKLIPAKISTTKVSLLAFLSPSCLETQTKQAAIRLFVSVILDVLKNLNTLFTFRTAAFNLIKSTFLNIIPSVFSPKSCFLQRIYDNYLFS